MRKGNEDLRLHKRNRHSGRSHMCPFCPFILTDLANLSRHIVTLHPCQIGILPGRSAEPLTLDAVMSGADLIELMTIFGVDTTYAVPYELFGVSYDDTHECHRWVAFEVTEALVESGEGVPNLPGEYKRCERVGGNQPISFQFFGAGCTHGHAAPKFLYKGHPSAFRESCLFPNISAQLLRFNTSGSRRWEENEKRLARANERVIVLTGPYYNANSQVGWVDCGCGYRLRVPEGFFRFLIIRNSGQHDHYQAFKYEHKAMNAILFAERETVEGLQDLVTWDFLPNLRSLTYTWDSTETAKYCQDCCKPIPALEYLDHFESHGLVCRLCSDPQMFDTRDELREHRKTHFAGKFRCEECDIDFESHGNLDRHNLAIHSGTRNLICPSCIETFSTQNALLDHVASVHAQVKSYYCPINNCRKGYSLKSKLEKHVVASHSSHHRFYCPHPSCVRESIVYGQRGNLTRHRETVHGKNPMTDIEIRSQTLSKFLKEVLAELGISKGQLYNRSNDMKEQRRLELANEILNIPNTEMHDDVESDDNEDE